MAKVDLIKAAYLGKLGQTVGQHWNNIYYIREWVKPHDPMSPRQMEVRDRFKVANELANLGMAMNGGAGFWASNVKSEYGQRVKQAMEYVKNGYIGLGAVPLYPSSVKPNIFLNGIKAVKNDRGSIDLICEDIKKYNAPIEIGICIKCHDVVRNDDIMFSFRKNVSNVDGIIYNTEENEDYVVTNESELVGCSSQGNRDNVVYLMPQAITGDVWMDETTYTVATGDMIFGYDEEGYPYIQLPDYVQMRCVHTFSISGNFTLMTKATDESVDTIIGESTISIKSSQTAKSNRYSIIGADQRGINYVWKSGLSLQLTDVTVDIDESRKVMVAIQNEVTMKKIFTDDQLFNSGLDIYYYGCYRCISDSFGPCIYFQNYISQSTGQLFLKFDSFVFSADFSDFSVHCRYSAFISLFFHTTDVDFVTSDFGPYVFDNSDSPVISDYDARVKWEHNNVSYPSYIYHSDYELSGILCVDTDMYIATYDMARMRQYCNGIIVDNPIYFYEKDNVFVSYIMHNVRIFFTFHVKIFSDNIYIRSCNVSASVVGTDAVPVGLTSYFLLIKSFLFFDFLDPLNSEKIESEMTFNPSATMGVGIDVDGRSVPGFGYSFNFSPVPVRYSDISFSEKNKSSPRVYALIRDKYCSLKFSDFSFYPSVEFLYD